MEGSDYRNARSYAAAGARLMHPVLMVLPIALLVAVLATDLAFWGTGDRFWVHAAESLLAIGLSLGAVAANLGLIAFITASRVRSRVAGGVYSLGNGLRYYLRSGTSCIGLKAIPVPRLFCLESFFRQSSLSPSSSRTG